MKKGIFNLFYPLFVILLVLLIWWIAALIIDVDLILPSPTEAFVNLFDYLKSFDFWKAIAGTILRSVESFCIAFIIAISLSLAAYFNKTIKKLITPLMAIVRSIPTMSIILILIIWFSPSIAPLVVAIIVICPTLYSSFLSGFLQIDLQIIEMANFYKVSKKRKIMKLFLPNMAPVLFETSASGISLNIKLIIAAEALAQTSQSIGKLMQYAKIAIETEKLFALTIAAVILSTLFEGVIRFIGKKVVRWQNVTA